MHSYFADTLDTREVILAAYIFYLTIDKAFFLMQTYEFVNVAF